MELGGFILAVVFTLIVVITFISVALLRSRKRVWAQFARRHGLTYEADSVNARVFGQLDGRTFQLLTIAESSDSGVMGAQEVRMEIALRGGVPRETRISRVEGWVGAIDRMSEPQAVATGDEDFDQMVLIESHFPEQVKAYLTPSRRELIRKLMLDAQADDAGIDEAALFIQDREMLTDIDRIEQRLELLRRLAPGLDATA